MTLANGWDTRQVDYTNALADIKETVFVELPRAFAASESGDYVLKLKKSLYGLKQAPKTFFDHLHTGLIERGFQQSTVDPCLFMKEAMLCVVYVDDTIFAGPDAAKKLDKMIKSLTDDHGETKSSYELEAEGSLQDFLGINIAQVSDKSFRLTQQTGLIKKILEKTGMTDVACKTMPTSTTAMGTDKGGVPFNEPWEYASVVGMLMYLGTNSRPDIAFSVISAPDIRTAIRVSRMQRR
jgi:histone deacetylase 1/2